MLEPIELDARELHQLWQHVPEGRRVAFLASLEERAADRLLAFQRGERARRPPTPTRRERNHEAVLRYRARKAAGEAG